MQIRGKLMGPAGHELKPTGVNARWVYQCSTCGEAEYREAQHKDTESIINYYCTEFADCEYCGGITLPRCDLQYTKQTMTSCGFGAGRIVYAIVDVDDEAREGTLNNIISRYIEDVTEGAYLFGRVVTEVRDGVVVNALPGWRVISPIDPNGEVTIAPWLQQPDDTSNHRLLVKTSRPHTWAPIDCVDAFDTTEYVIGWRLPHWMTW